MPDYKAMYFHLSGRMATAVEVLEMAGEALQATISALNGTSDALANLTEKLKLAQNATEDMFIGCDEEDVDDPSK